MNEGDGGAHASIFAPNGVWGGGTVVAAGLNRFGGTTNAQHIPRANPGTDSQFPASCAGNSVSVPGLRAPVSRATLFDGRGGGRRRPSKRLCRAGRGPLAGSDCAIYRSAGGRARPARTIGRTP